MEHADLLRGLQGGDDLVDQRGDLGGGDRPELGERLALDVLVDLVDPALGQLAGVEDPQHLRGVDLLELTQLAEAALERHRRDEALRRVHRDVDAVPGQVGGRVGHRAEA